jgi:nucleoside-diphosphate-sugar epimerase
MILVTGGTGLLGSYLLFELTKSGKPVRALVRDVNKTDHVRKLFCLLPGAAETQYSLIEWVEGDVLDITSIDLAMDGVDEVFHCAAMISFYRGNNAQMMKINAGGTANIVNACLKHGVRKLVHASSVAALGIPEKGDVIDETAVWKPSRRNGGYAISKYSAEREVWRGIEEGLTAAIVNPCVILGVSYKSVIANLIFYNLKRLNIFYTLGRTSYVDVRDVASAMILLMDNEISAQRFLISSESMSYKEFIGSGAEILGKRKPFIPVGRLWLEIVWRLNYLFSLITRTKPLFTTETIRPLSSETKYSSEKFRKSFGYSFIPVKQSLADGFRLLSQFEEK